MNPKHLKIRIEQCKLIASASPCGRRKVGALIIDPQSNTTISEGYNGTPRGSDKALCGGSFCQREVRYITSGTQNDIGCHHAEMNAILNATRTGISTLGAWLIVNCDPCLMCSKAIHHSGIVQVYTPLTTHSAGIKYLRENGIAIYSTQDI